MVKEAESIPYEAADLRGERLLVLAPHPDDEVIACGGLIALHARAGRPVRVVIATSGTEADPAADPVSYTREREEESLRGLKRLGVESDVVFLRLRDRQLGAEADAPLRDELAKYRPDLICAPSPVEIHPDHLALSEALCRVVAADPVLFAELATTRIAFYEVGMPLRPNALVDISQVAEDKYAAIAEHTTQTSIRDYVAYARGLNAYRAMTLERDVRFAEAYHVCLLPELRTVPFSALRQAVGTAARVEVSRETLPVAVVVRTKDRPALLREAVDSIRATNYPAEVVIVNDGGEAVDAADATLVRHDTSRGRSEAMNSGVRAAKSPFITFLDDDDLFYPEHLGTLAAAAAAGQQSGWYTDAVSARLRPSEDGTYRAESRQRLFSSDFDRDILLVDNYIPLTTLLVRRDDFLELGGFDPAFDLFEDWDFLIRLSQRGDLLHIPRITCEVRHFVGGSSILLASPPGSERFRAAKLQIWKKHAALRTDEVVAAAVEKLKQHRVGASNALVEEKGRRQSAEMTMARLERELRDAHASIGASLVPAGRIQQLESFVHDLRADLEAKAAHIASLQQDSHNLAASLTAAQNTAAAAVSEARRLQGLLDMIYRSRTWKLHTLVEKMRGR